MARAKRESTALDKLKTRVNGMKTIDPALDVGGGISVGALGIVASNLDAALSAYNMLLSEADDKLNKVIALEGQALDLAERALSGVLTKYGKDSSEYEKAGGKRKSERKRPVRTPRPPRP